MSRSATIDVFVEDRGHELLISALVRRIAREEQKSVELRVRSATGGHGRAMAEFRNYQMLVRKGVLRSPDVIIVAIDANCQRFSKKRSEIQSAASPSVRDAMVLACPDPHVERWYMADAAGFQNAVGAAARLGRKKCERGYYKRALLKAVRDAGHPATLGGLEFAAELAEKMDFYAAGRTDRSLAAFLNDLRRGIRRL